MRACLIYVSRIEIAYIGIDRKPEQQDLDYGNADDHAEGDAIAPQLQHFLAHHCDESTQAIHCRSPRRADWRVTATKTSSSDAGTIRAS